MAGSDPKTSRAFGQPSARPDIEAEEDPLIELARIVSEDGAFAPPKPAKPKAVRTEAFESRDLSDGLEAELLQELESSFGGREQPVPARSPAPVHETPPPVAPAPAPPRVSVAAVPEAPRASAAPAAEPAELDPDELLRSIEEQLGQFERRHAARFSPAPPSFTPPTIEPEPDEADQTLSSQEPGPPIFGAPSVEAQNRRSSRIRPFAEIDEPAEEPVADEPQLITEAARSDYRFRGPASAQWDPVPIEEEAGQASADEMQSLDPPPRFSEPEPDADLFAGEAPDTFRRAGVEPRGVEEDSLEARRRERREAVFPEFDEPPAAESPQPDLTGIEASLSRELEPDYAAPSQEDKWQDGDAPADEPPVAATIAPGPSRRAAAARAAAEQRSRSRVGLLTAAGIIVVVVLGAGGALYLRSSDQGPSGPPPVIAADDQPVRVEPAEQQAAEGETVGEAVYNRVAGATPKTEEQVVESAEEPNEIARIVLPPSQTGSEETVVRPVGEEPADAEADAPAPMTQNTPATSQAVVEEIGPRRVPTYIVRADGSIVETSAIGGVASDPASAQSQQLASETAPIEPTPVETVVIPESEATTAAADPLPLPVPPAPVADATPATDGVDMTPRPTIDEQPEIAIVAPPTETIEAAPFPEAPTDISGEPSASVDVAGIEPAAVPPPPATAGEGYLVQLSAQRSMEQAQAAFATAQQSFTSVLGSLSPQIQEADLGQKGIYYRVRVGPWATRDEAIGVCESLKAAGGSCFVTQ